jgi:tetratricopeptide (TPR) repeat protein
LPPHSRIDAGRQVLEADILTSVAALAQVRGDTEQAIELVDKALSLSEQTGNLYGKARALGELGRLKVLSGKNDEGWALINEALDVDRLNGYKFEALHLYYRGVYLGIAGKQDEAIQSVVEARNKAAAARDISTFISAENSYALGLVQTGHADEALREMNLIESANLDEFIKDSSDKVCMVSSLQTPLMQLIWLEGFANVLDGAHQTEKEIDTWRRIFSISEGLGLLDGEAEAKQKTADLENRLKRTEDAVIDYKSAADLYRKLQNKVALDQVDVAEAVLLVQLNRGKEAVPIVGEITAYAKDRGLRGLEFSSYLELGEIYQPAGDMNEARAALEKAQSLVHPGPFDSEIDNHQVHEAYVRLSDVYRALALPTKELVSTDKAYFVSAHLHDDKSQQGELNYLNQRLSDLGVSKLADQSQKSGQLADSLIYSYVLYIHDGFPSKPTDDQSNWQRIQSLPFQIAQQPHGNEILQSILTDVGPMLGFEKFPLLSALARYYIGPRSDPVLAEKYATEAEAILNDLKGDFSSLKTEPTCVLALSHARQNKSNLAEQESEECLRLAATSKDQQTIGYADAVKVLVDTQTGHFESTKSSLENLLAKAPDDPELRTELAISLASAKLYDQASSQLQAATAKFISAGETKTAAEAFVHVASALTKDSSDRAKALQLQYLNTAVQEYRECGASAEEAETLILLGDYYSAQSQISPAIEA